MSAHYTPRLKKLALLAFALFNVPLSAQAMGLLELYRAAQNDDPIYAAAKAERQAADSLVTQSRGQLLPQLGISASKMKNDQTVRTDTPFGERQQEYEFEPRNASLNLSQALFRPQAWLAYSQSHAQVQQAEGIVRQARNDLILRLTQSYFEVLLAGDNVTLMAEQKRAIDELLKQAKRYFEAGVGTITDINEAQARYDSVSAQELAAQNNLEIRIRALEQLVGGVHRDLNRLGSRLALEQPNPLEIDQWVEFTTANNPVIKAREAALRVAEKEVHKNMAAHLPTVDIVASRSLSQDPSYTTLNTRSDMNSIGLQVSIPLFSGGTTHGRVNQASSLREKARHELEAAKRSMTTTARQEYMNVMNGVAQVRALEQAVKSNEVALYSAQKGQEAGMRTSFDVLNAQQLLFTAKRDLAQGRYSYVLARLKLRSAAGLLDDEDVELVQTWLDVSPR